MREWLRKIDDRLFSPPHRFETIFAFITVRLPLVFTTIEQPQRIAEIARETSPAAEHKSR